MGMGILDATPLIDASVDSMSSQAHFPVEGTITITHSKEEKIDATSFKIEDKPLKVSFLKDVNMSASGDTLVSIYSFQLPAQEKGLYVLPAIAVQVGGQTYQTAPSTYEVKSETTSQSISPATAKSTPIIFRLKATVEGPTSLFPGERTKLLYRISYNRSVDLTRSVLPMVHPAHFQKIGDVQIRDYQQQDVTVQDLTQEVEASDLGTFQLGPSSIEGYAYTMQNGQKVYEPTLLKSEAPALTLEVKPFPRSHQPPSFTGALGKIRAEASLESSNSIFVGDDVQVQVNIQGITNLTELRLPSLQCQPGFSGFFQTSDLPPPAEVKEGTKIFHVELRPLTSLVEQLPSIEVSSFDPKSGQYVVQHTSPISLTVKAHPIKISSQSFPSVLTKIPLIGTWPTPQLYPLEFHGRPVQLTEMKTFWEATSRVLWLLPIGLGLLLLQKYWHEQSQKRPKPHIPKSEQLLQQAFQTDSLKLIEQAFWSRLWEKGMIPQGSFELDRIPEQNQLKLVRSFLLQLQTLQYSPDHTFDPSQIKQTAQQLFEKISRS
jgi:hypothetical protein